VTVNKKKLPKAIRPAAADPARTAAAPNAMPKSETPIAMETAPLDATEMQPDVRRASAVKLVERLSLWSGAGGLIPVPFVDLGIIGSVQIGMVGRIAKIYGVPFSKNRGKTLIASLLGSMIPVSSAMGAASLMKSVPVVGAFMSAFAMPAMSAAATYAIGMVFIQHFASGGTLLDFNAPDYREFIKTQKESWSARATRRS
jgi:uncharacterized protein (DUF697 family)